MIFRNKLEYLYLELFSSLVLCLLVRLEPNLLTNIRLGWKILPETNTSLLQKFVNYGNKKFYNIGPRSDTPSCDITYDRHSYDSRGFINAP
jgi:hypothetical protein